MIRAYLRRFIGGGLDGPLRSLPQESVARAKPALEPDHSTRGRANPHSLLASRRGSAPLSSAGFAGAISDCSPRTHGAQPVAVLRLGLPDRSPRTAGPQPRDVLRLAVRPGGRVRKGGE